MTPLPSVLIVDDDPIIIAILRRALDGLGVLYSAASGEEALAWVAGHPVDLVLLDVMLPDMDGFSICAAVRRDHPDLPVIFMTVASDPATEVRALAAGGSDFIGKPINLPAVRARVGLHLRFRAQEAECRRAREEVLALRAGLDRGPSGAAPEARTPPGALGETGERLEATLNALPDLMFRLDREGTVQEFRSSAMEQLYLPPERFLGRKVSEVLPAEAARVIMDALEETAAQGRHHGGTYSLPMPQGESWFEISMAAIGEGGHPGHEFVMLVREITRRVWAEREVQALNAGLERRVAERTADLEAEIAERKRIEEELRETERSLRELSNTLEQQVEARTADVRAANGALRAAEERSRTVLNAMDALIYIVDMETHELVFLNQAAARVFGAVAGQPCYRALQGLDSPCCFCPNDRLVDGDGNPTGLYQWEQQNRIDQRWYDLRDRALRWTDGRLVKMQIASDMTGRRQIEEQLRISEERYRAAFQNSLDAITITRLTDGLYVDVNQGFVATMGFERGEAVGHTAVELGVWAEPGDRKFFVERIRANQEVRDFETRLRKKNGELLWGLVSASPVEVEGVACILSVTRDITERKRAERELRAARDAAETANRALQAANGELNRLATTDGLTGIWNRRHFDQVAEAEIARARRYGHALSLLMFDLDHFKSVNDRFGHLVGDQVLVELARLVKGNLRAADMLARWGGEEFVVMMPHCNRNDARRLAEKLRRLLADWSFPAVGTLTGSFGGAELRPDETFDDWLKRVDDALYLAKSAGRNTVCLAECQPD